MFLAQDAVVRGFVGLVEAALVKSTSRFLRLGDTPGPGLAEARDTPSDAPLFLAELLLKALLAGLGLLVSTIFVVLVRTRFAVLGLGSAFRFLGLDFGSRMGLADADVEARVARFAGLWLRLGLLLGLLLVDRETLLSLTDAERCLLAFEESFALGFAFVSEASSLVFAGGRPLDFAGDGEGD